MADNTTRQGERMRERERARRVCIVRTEEGWLTFPFLRCKGGGGGEKRLSFVINASIQHRERLLPRLPVEVQSAAKEFSPAKGLNFKEPF